MREQERRQFWEQRIPPHWQTMPVADAFRAVNAGRRCRACSQEVPDTSTRCPACEHPVPHVMSRKTLERLASTGELGAFGGPGTGVRRRVTRVDLVDYLVRRLDPLEEPQVATASRASAGDMARVRGWLKTVMARSPGVSDRELVDRAVVEIRGHLPDRRTIYRYITQEREALAGRRATRRAGVEGTGKRRLDHIQLELHLDATRDSSQRG